MADLAPAGNDHAVFLDRDGVINRRRPDHVKSWAEFEFLPGVLDAFAQLHEAGTRVVVVTNQSAVGRGLVPQEVLSDIHRRMTAALRAAGGHIEATYVCPHIPDAGCRCRKPATELFYRASADLDIALRGSVVVGDARSDIEAARAFGGVPILVADHRSPDLDQSIQVARDLAHAVRLVVAMRHKEAAASC
jgi:histidinol-phosphate phosphatase family protein